MKLRGGRHRHRGVAGVRRVLIRKHLRAAIRRGELQMWLTVVNGIWRRRSCREARATPAVHVGRRRRSTRIQTFSHKQRSRDDVT